MVAKALNRRLSTAQPDANKPRFRYVLQANRPEVVAILATGTQPADVARLYNVEVSTVTRFADKYAEPIAAMRAEVIEEVEDYAIAQKVNRVATLDRLLGLMVAEVDANGVMVTEREYGKDGAIDYETRVLQDKLIREIRGVLKDAAEEMGQLDKGSVNVNIDNRTQAVKVEINEAVEMRDFLIAAAEAGLMPKVQPQ